MDNIIEVSTGEVKVSKGGTIKTFGIGSCVAICMYDRKNQIGGMAHSMLPTRKIKSKGTGDRQAKYIDDAIKILVDEIKAKGADMDRVAVKITGGANIIHSHFDLGKQNVEFAKKLIKDLGIEIKGEDVGGTIGRIAEFNVSNGILHIRTAI